MIDPFLKALVSELCEKHGCHSVLLYGSRARGDHRPDSDYDVLGIRARGSKLRIAEIRGGRYIDAFVYPESDLRHPSEEHLHLHEAQVLVSGRDSTRRWLQQLKHMAGKKPKPLPKNELVARKVWARKMLDRARHDDLEGRYRRTWLLTALLEDYFVLRGKRYPGSRAAFSWLQRHDPKTYRNFVRALASPANLRKLKSLVESVIRSKI